MIIKERLSSLMGINGITVGELNDEFGNGFFSSLICGEVPSKDVDKLCKILNTNREYLMGIDMYNSDGNPTSYQIKPDILKERRKAVGYGMVSLAALLGCNPNWIYEIENRNGSRNHDLTMALCHYLKCCPEYLIGLTSNPNATDVPALPASIAEKARALGKISTVIGKRLYDAMHKADISANKLVKTHKRIALPVNYIRRAMASDCIMPNNSIMCIANVLGVDPTYLAPMYRCDDAPKKVKQNTTIATETEKEYSIDPSEVEQIKAEPVSTSSNTIEVDALIDTVNLMKNKSIVAVCNKLMQLSPEQQEYAVKALDYMVNGIMVTD